METQGIWKTWMEKIYLQFSWWIFQIRKEVFSPSEQLTNPTTIHLVFCQAIKPIKLFAGVLHSIPHIDEPRDGQSKRQGTCLWPFHALTKFICHLLLFWRFTDVQCRSSLTPSVLSASAWLSQRGGRWWATWTSTTSAPRTSTVRSTRTQQR